MTISSTVPSGFVEIGIGHKRSDTDDVEDELILSSHDGNLALYAPGNSFDTSLYVVVNPTNALPGPPPPGTVAVGQAYALQPSGSVTGSQRAMAVTLSYQSISLGDVAEETIKPYYWAAAPDGGGQWTPILSYTLDRATQQVSASSKLFGIYTLFGDVPGPTIDSITPDSGDNQQATSAVISGRNFAAGAEVKVGETLVNSTFVNAQTVLVDIPPGLTPGSYSVTVTNPDGTSGSLPNGFTVTGVAMQRLYLPLILK